MAAANPGRLLALADREFRAPSKAKVASSIAFSLVARIIGRVQPRLLIDLSRAYMARPMLAPTLRRDLSHWISRPLSALSNW
jgi:hypothetical protein